MKKKLTLKDAKAILQIDATKAVRDAGVLRQYRAATIARCLEVFAAGIANPKYALYCQDDSGQYILIGHAARLDDLRWVRRRARSFSKRVLQRVYRFRIVKTKAEVLSLVG